jgi:hypothetical protein
LSNWKELVDNNTSSEGTEIIDPAGNELSQEEIEAKRLEELEKAK